MNYEGQYTPSYFSATFCLRDNPSQEQDCLAEFVRVTKRRPDMRVATKSFVGCLTLSPSVKVAVDRQRQVILILHGEVYNSMEADEAEYLLKQYFQQGQDFSKEINGSFAILIIDEAKDSIALITDRVNSRKVFSSEHKSGHWLSTSLSLHPTADHDLDVVGVASYLANGVIHNGRTLFEGVNILERACVHTLTDQGFRSLRYWTYEFNNLYSGVDQKRLRAELSELIVESVKTRLKDNPQIFLSLSGGYDSSGILGVLARILNVRGVKCFSYVHGRLWRNRDGYVSRKMADYFGFDHELLESYEGDFIEALRTNAAQCGGHAQFCDEIDAWKRFASLYSGTARGVLLVADECFGWTDWNLFSDAGVLASLAIRDFGVLSWLSKRMPEESYKRMYDELREETVQIISRCPPTEDYHQRKDFLYLDQRLNYRLLVWRERFAGEYMQVRNPFLDNGILDFMKKVPTGLRRGKHLYKKTITEMFPDLFAIKRAKVAGFIPDWRDEFCRYTAAVEELIRSQASRLDNVVPPDVIFRLLKENGRWRTRQFAAGRLLAGVVRKFSRARLAGKIMWPWAKMFARYDPTKIVDHTTLLKRMVVMRLFLGQQR
jgi:asparagine synthetase B (glutamine-hydrolysing)